MRAFPRFALLDLVQKFHAAKRREQRFDISKGIERAEADADRATLRCLKGAVPQSGTMIAAANADAPITEIRPDAVCQNTLTGKQQR